MRHKEWFALDTSREDAELVIFDEIGFWGTDARTVLWQLEHLDATDLTVRINSPGGNVFDGFAIYNSLRASKARVTTIVEGLAASAASVIALAGDRVVMREASELMIHDAWTFSDGNADELRTVADELERVSGIIAGIYAKKAGTPVDMWRDAMRTETWFTPDEALQAGLVDAVDGRVEVENRFDLTIFNHAGRAEAGRPSLLAHTVSSALAEEEGGIMPTMQDELRQLVGISDEQADDDTIVAAVREALAEQTDTAAEDEEDDTVPLTVDQFTRLAEAFDMHPDDNPGDVVDEVVARLSAEDEPEDSTDADVVAVDRGRFEELVEAESRLVEYSDRDARDEAEKLVAAAVEDGRLAAASRDRWVSKLLADPEDAKPRLASISKARIPRDELGRSDADSESSEVRSELDDKAAHSGFDLSVKL